MTKKDNSYWMNKAISKAKEGGTAFGAVIVNEDETCIEAFNTTKQDGPTAHAEINVIQKLKQLNYTDAKQLRLYTTVEPCPMCMSAIVWTGIGTVVFGASISDAAKYGHQIHISAKEIAEKSWYSITLIGGVEREMCVGLFKK